MGQESVVKCLDQVSGSLVRGQESRVSCQGSLVKCHWSESEVSDQRSVVNGQTIFFRGHWSAVTGQNQGSLHPDP